MPALSHPLSWLDAPRRRDFALFFLARGLAALAGQIQTVAVGWQVYDMTGDVMALGYVGLALFLPVVVCTLPAGDAADRFDRRRVVICSYVVQGAGAGMLALLAALEHTDMALLYATLVAIGAARALAGPAQQSFLPLLVPRAALARAVGIPADEQLAAEGEAGRQDDEPGDLVEIELVPRLQDAGEEELVAVVRGDAAAEGQREQQDLRISQRLAE